MGQWAASCSARDHTQRPRGLNQGPSYSETRLTMFSYLWRLGLEGQGIFVRPPCLIIRVQFTSFCHILLAAKTCSSCIWMLRMSVLGFNISIKCAALMIRKMGVQNWKLTFANALTSNEITVLRTNFTIRPCSSKMSRVALLISPL